MTVQCPFFIKVSYMILYNSVVFLYLRCLFNSSYKNLNRWTTSFCFGMELLCKKNKQIENFVSTHIIRIVTKK